MPEWVELVAQSHTHTHPCLPVCAGACHIADTNNTTNRLELALVSFFQAFRKMYSWYDRLHVCLYVCVRVFVCLPLSA